MSRTFFFLYRLYSIHAKAINDKIVCVNYNKKIEWKKVERKKIFEPKKKPQTPSELLSIIIESSRSWTERKSTETTERKRENNSKKSTEKN